MTPPSLKLIRGGAGERSAGLGLDEHVDLQLQQELSRYRRKALEVCLSFLILLPFAALPLWAPLLPGVSPGDAAYMRTWSFAAPMLLFSLVMGFVMACMYWPVRPRTRAEIKDSVERQLVLVSPSLHGDTRDGLQRAG
jgi:hypothetical protein